MTDTFVERLLDAARKARGCAGGLGYLTVTDLEKAALVSLLIESNIHRVGHVWDCGAARSFQRDCDCFKGELRDILQPGWRG